MSRERKTPDLKPLLAERLKLLMSNNEDYQKFLEILSKAPDVEPEKFDKF